MARFKPHCSDVLLAEAWAVRDGLVEAIEAGYHNIIVECDSLGLVSLINFEEMVLSEVRAFIDDIRSLSTSVTAKVQYIFREGNKLAHELANFALKSSCSKIWDSDFPSWLMVHVNWNVGF